MDALQTNQSEITTAVSLAVATASLPLRVRILVFKMPPIGRHVTVISTTQRTFQIPHKGKGH